MRILALYDVHGNADALEAVLADPRAAGPDAIVVGGDVVPGPMPVETVDRVRALGERTRFVMGNADREVVEMFDAGTRIEEVAEDWMRMSAWGAGLLDRARRDFLAAFEPTVRLEAGDVGRALFCHGSPRADTEIITALTPPERLAPMLAGVEEPIVVCGHTHNQFVLEHDGRRVVNAGSVGMPYQGAAAAFWLLLGPTSTCAGPTTTSRPPSTPCARPARPGSTSRSTRASSTRWTRRPSRACSRSARPRVRRSGRR
jgi:predicted phosphodiesterase